MITTKSNYKSKFKALKIGDTIYSAHAYYGYEDDPDPSKRGRLGVNKYTHTIRSLERQVNSVFVNDKWNNQTTLLVKTSDGNIFTVEDFNGDEDYFLDENDMYFALAHWNEIHPVGDRHEINLYDLRRKYDNLEKNKERVKEIKSQIAALQEELRQIENQ